MKDILTTKAAKGTKIYSRQGAKVVKIGVRGSAEWSDASKPNTPILPYSDIPFRSYASAAY